MPVSRAQAAFVRLPHPTTFGLFYNKEDPINPWTAKDYTRWPISEWEGKFGAAVTNGEDVRKWEFFGFVIPLYNDTKT